MSDIALQIPTADTWRRLVDASRQVLLGIVQGFAAAQRHQRLAAMSDAELARRGLTREDVPWFAAYGERRPHCVRAAFGDLVTEARGEGS
jgi:hypothetical protein